MNKRKQRPGPEVTGERAFIPQWLLDPTKVAPCMCGRPMMEDEPYIIAESQLGLKRWWHPQCWHYFMNPSYLDSDEDD